MDIPYGLLMIVREKVESEAKPLITKTIFADGRCSELYADVVGFLVVAETVLCICRHAEIAYIGQA